MRRSIASLLLLSAIALASACASGGSSTGSSTQGSRNAPITAEQARETGAANAFDVVQSLRPTWLRMRGGSTGNSAANEIIVYLDNTRLGGLESLRQIGAASIVTIEFVDARTAQFRWGSGHMQGVIQVKTH